MIRSLITYFVLTLLLYPSRKNDKGKLAQPEIICITPDSVSFANDLIPLFNKHCNGSGCHAGTNPGGNLSLDSAAAYNQLMNPASGYVDTINPSYSVLYAEMNSESNPMPPTGKLDKCSLELVLKWIKQKAKNN